MGVTRKIGRDISMHDKKINFPFESGKIFQVAGVLVLEKFLYQGKMYVISELRTFQMDETHN